MTLAQVRVGVNPALSPLPTTACASQPIFRAKHGHYQVVLVVSYKPGAFRRASAAYSLTKIKPQLTADGYNEVVDY